MVCLFAAISNGYSQCGPLTTLFAQDNGQDGIMFDIEGVGCVIITQFEMNMDPGTHDIEIYTTAGSIFGSTQNTGAFTLVGTANGVVSAGNNNPTLIPITLSVPIQQGQTVGFYVTTIGGGMNYTGIGGTTPPVTPPGTVSNSDANIRVMVGVGKAYPFDTDFFPRNPNTIVHYTCTGCCTPPIMSQTEPLCAGGASGTITAEGQGNAPWSYVWADANGNVVQTTNSVNGPNTATGLIAGDYTVSVTDGANCTAIETATLTDPPALSTTTTSTATSCNAGNDGTATATGEGIGPWTYQWFDASNSSAGVGNGINGPHTATGLLAGTYTVSVTDANGCGAVGQVDVTEPTVIAAVQSQIDNLCNGDTNGSATVSGITGGTPGYTIQWDDINAQTGATATGLPAGLYNALITDANGCELEQAFIIDEPDPLIVTTIPATDTCGKSVGSIGLSIIGGTTPFTFVWDHGDSLQVADSLMQGTYSVVLMDVNGCTDSAKATIGNIPAPKAAFTFVTDPEDIFEHTVTFTNTSGNASYYIWDFDDGNYSDEEHPEHLYEADSTFGVHLIAYNDYNCFDTVVGFVRLEPHFTMYIPNAFTPGKNGINDTFEPKGYGYDYDSFHMTIFDRWGSIVFQSNDIAQGWDGKSHINGEWVPSGVYNYKITVREPIGHEPKHFYGSVRMLKH